MHQLRSWNTINLKPRNKKTGVVISGIGAGLIVLGFALRNAVGKGFRIGKNKDVILNLSALMVFIGAPITITGLSFYFTGTSRVDKIRTINNTAYDNIHIDPCAQYNLTTQNYQPGVTLRIKFLKGLIAKVALSCIHFFQWHFLYIHLQEIPSQEM